MATENTNDGSMPTRAIVQQAKETLIIVEGEHEWLCQKHLGHIVKSQELITDNEKYLDRVTIVAGDGQQLTVYFDDIQSSNHAWHHL